MSYSIGIDVGGTNTDAALLSYPSLDCGDALPIVIHTLKTPTTIPSSTLGITTAITRLLAHTRVPTALISSITIGTTAFVNALVEADKTRLKKVHVLRLTSGYAEDIPPMVQWPQPLRKAVRGGYSTGPGGLEVTGEEIAGIDVRWVREKALWELGGDQPRDVVVVGVFSPLDESGKQEYAVREIVRHMHEDEVTVVCSRDVGGIGFIERENAAILNSTLLRYAKCTIADFEIALKTLGLPETCQLFLTTNLGTLCRASEARKKPIKTFTCGPTNSIAGAAFLAGLTRNSSFFYKQTIVVDIGGTTTDVGALEPTGLPRQSSTFIQIADVRIASPMPDILSVPLGGGSIVVYDPNREAGGVAVGPRSVGARITVDSLLAGGSVCTITDVAVAAGIAPCPPFGNPNNVRGNIPAWVLAGVRAFIKKTLTDAIEAMKTSAATAAVLLVGGGAGIVDLKDIEGVVFIPVPHADAANAVGAAVAKVEGCVERLVIGDDSVDEVEMEMKKQAVTLAVRNGAKEGAVEVVSVEKLQLQYVDPPIMRVVVRAVGVRAFAVEAVPDIAATSERGSAVTVAPLSQTPASYITPPPSQPPRLPSPVPRRDINLTPYDTPQIRGHFWYLSAMDIVKISRGCALLSCGGGGSASTALLHTLALLARATVPPVVIHPSLIRPNCFVLPGSGYGAPTISAERISSASNIFRAQQALLDRLSLNVDSVDALLTDEVGGGNGLSAICVSMAWGREMGLELPVVDADCMGRAFPEMGMATPYLPDTGCAIQPVVVAGGPQLSNAHVEFVDGIENNDALETHLRTLVTTCFGRSAAVVASPLTGDQLRQHAVSFSISRAWRLGALVNRDVGRELFQGKIVEVQNSIADGYTRGHFILAPLNTTAAPDESYMKIPFMNEYLYAALLDGTTESKILVAVPDLIVLTTLDAERTPVGVEELRYGLRVRVGGLRCDRRWRTPGGLKVGGLGAFGLAQKQELVEEWPEGDDEGDDHGGDGGFWERYNDRSVNSVAPARIL